MSIEIDLNFKTKKPTYQELADYFGVSKSAVQQYKPVRRDLMIIGLWTIKEAKFYEEKRKELDNNFKSFTSS